VYEILVAVFAAHSDDKRRKESEGISERKVIMKGACKMEGEEEKREEIICEYVTCVNP
jgi:hypothetical protein